MVMFIHVSTADLCGPVGPDVKAYVDQPHECSKPGICGLRGYWLYGMRRLASHGWQEEYRRQLEKLGFVSGEACPMLLLSSIR